MAQEKENRMARKDEETQNLELAGAGPRNLTAAAAVASNPDLAELEVDSDEYTEEEDPDLRKYRT